MSKKNVSDTKVTKKDEDRKQQRQKAISFLNPKKIQSTENVDKRVDVREVKINLLHPNPFQPRQYFDKEEIESLAASIKAQGFFGHLLVRQTEVGSGFELAYGERRLRAAKIAGLETIPVQIQELDDKKMLELALIENVQRTNLNPVEEARGYKKLQEVMDYTLRDIEEKMGVSKTKVGELLSLLRYPEIEQAVLSGLAYTTALQLAKIEEEETRNSSLQKVLKGEMSREELIASIQERKSGEKNRQQVSPSGWEKRLIRFSSGFDHKDFQKLPTTQEERELAKKALQDIVDKAQKLLHELQSSSS